jgi:hypothetical protein
MEVANMQRFGERWRSPEANSLCQLLIRDQSPNHDFLILALQPELVVGECTESTQQTRGATLAVARWVSDEDRARLIKRVFTCRWPTQSGNEQQELAARRIGSTDPMTVREMQSTGLSKVFEWTKYLRELATAIGPIDDSEILVQRDRWPTTQPYVEPPRWKNWSGIKEELHYNYHPPSTQP